MLKKISVLFVALAVSFGYAHADLEKLEPQQTDVRIGEQYEAVPTTTPSQEVDYVEESPTAHSMAQAEKAENVRKYDSFGGGITIIAMCIVIGALIVLSILFFIFGKISSWFLTHKKKQTARVMQKEGIEANQDLSPDSGVTIAAISAALAQHFSQDHDMQNTILTIKRMRKAYSPWNSKIYNMRHVPELVHAPKAPSNKK